MRTVDLIHRKRDGEELSADEIQFLVDGYTRGDIPDYQMSAFLMAVFFSGMSDREVRRSDRKNDEFGRLGRPLVRSRASKWISIRPAESAIRPA